jgi:hypothetical protein
MESAMPNTEIHLCQCLHCQQETAHPDQVLHQQMNLLLSRFDFDNVKMTRPSGE